MTNELNHDVVVDSVEWMTLLDQLEKKDGTLRDVLDKFIEALDILVNDGFVSGNRQENMKTFKQEVENLRSQLDGIYASTKSSIYTLAEETETVDHYTSLFPWL